MTTNADHQEPKPDVTVEAQSSMEDYLAIEAAAKRKGMDVGDYILQAAATVARLSNAMHDGGLITTEGIGKR